MGKAGEGRRDHRVVARQANVALFDVSRFVLPKTACPSEPSTPISPGFSPHVRSFFRNGTVWTDSAAQGKGRLERRQVRFASAEYFELLHRNREMAGLLWLGNEIDVVVDDTLYEIRGN